MWEIDIHHLLRSGTEPQVDGAPQRRAMNSNRRYLEQGRKYTDT